MNKGWQILALGAIAAAVASGSAGCHEGGGGGGGGESAAVAGPGAPGSGTFAIDCTNQRAYVPLNSLDGATGNGQVAVLDLSVDPNTNNPRIGTVVLSHPDIPAGTTLDNNDHLIIVVSGKTPDVDGFIDIIDESSNTLVAGSPFRYPAGSKAGKFGQVLFDPVRNQVIVETCESASDSNDDTCNLSSSPLTGFVTFDPVAHTFRSIVHANYAETFGFDPVNNTVLDGSDTDNLAQIGIVDLANSRTCTLSDSNVSDDNDGTSVDPTTGIAVVGNENGTVAVLNLNGASFSAPSVRVCTVNEAAGNNSVLISGLPGATAGSATSPISHQVFMIEDEAAGMALLTLPSSPLSQLSASDVTAQSSSIPNDPDGVGWSTQGDPYMVAISTCSELGNKGFAINGNFTFLVDVDLDAFHADPSAVAASLPAAPPSCGGTSTSLQCSNGAGVRFFPLTTQPVPPQPTATPIAIRTATPRPTPNPIL